MVKMALKGWKLGECAKDTGSSTHLESAMNGEDFGSSERANVHRFSLSGPELLATKNAVAKGWGRVKLSRTFTLSRIREEDSAERSG